MIQAPLREEKQLPDSAGKVCSLEVSIEKSWERVAPFWPLSSLVAVNPLAGFERLPFEEALQEAAAYFQQRELPEPMRQVNRESIKWLQAFVDEGQSTISMPLRRLGLLKAAFSLLRFDAGLGLKDPRKLRWFQRLPREPKALIAEALAHLGIQEERCERFLTLMLTTLPGWAAYLQYRISWAERGGINQPHGVTKEDYLAFRLLLTCLLWPEANKLLSWHEEGSKKADVGELCARLSEKERGYRSELVKTLGKRPGSEEKGPFEAQLIFCIDVRSEPFRRALEAQGAYETFGFAGFFGLPIAVEHAVTKEVYPSCPVLLSPSHQVKEVPLTSFEAFRKGHQRAQRVKKLYQSLKYSFATPFSLAETLGLGSGLWMALKTFSPKLAAALKKRLRQALHPPYPLTFSLEAIPFDRQVAYASSALKMMGLTRRFAPLVVLCAHGSTTENNAHAAALDCGACGGRHGAPNASILAEILNAPRVRMALKKEGVEIPQESCFLAAKHDTSTDEVELYDHGAPAGVLEGIASLKRDLQAARLKNSAWRSLELGLKARPGGAVREAALRSQDWAEVRPEWGLARNASFLAAPRELTRGLDLKGRSFLHSYDWKQDEGGGLLSALLTGPMLVAQWINAQYLFSSLDNVAFGGGSKVTKNITGRIGAMQGNASDLMHGLPLQSVNRSDLEPYHEPMRLSVVVFAPRPLVESVLEREESLRRLFEKGWAHLTCLDPADERAYSLERDLTWKSFF